MNDKIIDIAIHVQKQKLELDVILMGQCFYEQHKMIYGSNKHKYGHDYSISMQKRYDWIQDKIWDVIESKISYNKYEPFLKKEYEAYK